MRNHTRSVTLREKWGLGGFLLFAAAALAWTWTQPPFVERAFALDSDGDGLSDGFENAYGTNPLAVDTDTDSWSDWQEIFQEGTDPTNADTDGDGLGDAADPDPRSDNSLSGGSADGNTTPTSTYASNLTRPNLNGTSARDGKGVYVHSGEFVHTVEFMRIKAGIGPDIVLSATYRSGVSYDGILGNNWFPSWGEHVVELGNGDVEYYQGGGAPFFRGPRRPDWGGKGKRRPGDSAGTKVTFTENAGAYTGPDDAIYLGLTKDGGAGTFTLTDTHGNKRKFRSDGQVEEWEDRFGNKVTYTYDGSGTLTGISDAAGHSVTVSYYSTTGRVWKLTDGDSRVVEFVYNYHGQLAKWITPTSTEYPTGRVFEYRYSSGSSTGTLNDNMIWAKDPKGQKWLQIEFNALDRVTKQYLGNDFLTFSYSGGTTSVTDRELNDRDWVSSGALPTTLKEYSNRNVRTTDPTSWDTTFAHTTAGLLKKVVHPEGNRVDFTYDSSGNLTERRRRTTDTDTNDPSDLVDAWTYDSTYDLMTGHTDPKGNETTYTLDTNNKVVESVTYETVTYLDPDQTVTESLSWTSAGQLDETTDGEGKKVDYQYVGATGVKQGYLWKVVVDSGIGGLALTTEYGYTNWGAVTSVKNPRTYTTTYTVNEYDWRTKIETTTPQGYETIYAFDANGNVTQKDVENVDETNTRSTTNPWFSTTYTYDLLDNLLTRTEEVTSATTRAWSWDYTKNEKLKTLTKPEGNKVRFEYDERDLVFKKTRGYDATEASTEQWDYDENRNLVTYKNGRGKSWTYAYDDFDRRTKATNPLGHYAVFTYDENSNLTETQQYEEAGTTDVLMAHTKQTFDEMDRLYKVERGLEGVSSWSWLATTLTFDKRSLVTKVTDPRSKDMSFTYDGASRRTRVQDHLGNKVDSTYDANGNVTKVEEVESTGHASAKTFVTDLQYDELDRRKQQDVVDETNSSNKHTTTWKYDSLHVMVEQVDPESNATTWTHDGLARILTKSVDLGSGNSVVTTWAYDDNSRMTSLQDDGSNETTWAYNARDLVTSETFADTGQRTFYYDLADNVTGILDPIGNDITRTFDDDDRLTAVDVTRATGVGGTTEEDYLYDALDRMTEAKDNDVTVQFTWDSLGRKETEVSGPNPIGTSGKTTSYTYDDAGNVTRIDYPDGTFYVTRNYDDVNRLTAVKDPSLNSVVAVGYYGAGGRLKKLTFENGTTSEHGYDGFRWLSDLDHKDSGATTFAGYDMARDKVGNILYEEWSHDSGKGNNYSYDKSYRLKTALMGTADPSNEHANPGTETYVEKLQYNLSDDSDRTSVVTTPFQQSPVTVNYTSNAVHEYTAVGGVNRTYDDNGNLSDDGTNEYQYDFRNQLITVTRKSDSTVIGAYEYDALGRRTRKTLEDSSEIRFYHDGVHEIEEFDGSDDLLRKYVYRTTIDSIAMMEAPDQADVDDDQNTTELKRFYYHLDGRTNVARLTDPDEVVVESYETDPYGNVTISNLSGNPEATSPVGNPIRFHRLRHEEETGFLYVRARHYDPRIGHWLQRDPSGYSDGTNLHEFAHSAPTRWLDPSGLGAVVITQEVTPAEAAKITKEFRDNGVNETIIFTNLTFSRPASAPAESPSEGGTGGSGGGSGEGSGGGSGEGSGGGGDEREPGDPAGSGPGTGTEEPGSNESPPPGGEDEKSDEEKMKELQEELDSLETELYELFVGIIWDIGTGDLPSANDRFNRTKDIGERLLEIHDEMEKIKEE